jgi:hypothetical protein
MAAASPAYPEPMIATSVWYETQLSEARPIPKSISEDVLLLVVMIILWFLKQQIVMIAGRSKHMFASHCVLAFSLLSSLGFAKSDT